MSPPDFITSFVDAAQRSSVVSRIPASFTIAEAALESAWGQSLLAINGLNYFGVKAGPEWTGPTIDMNTREYLNGAWVMVPARWRKYAMIDDCIVDHASFLVSNPRYHECFAAQGGEAFAIAAAKAGYATDPAYAQKIIEIMRAHNLSQYDGVQQ